MQEMNVANINIKKYFLAKCGCILTQESNSHQHGFVCESIRQCPLHAGDKGKRVSFTRPLEKIVTQNIKEITKTAAAVLVLGADNER
jgi:hypothetical protein